jgi:short subunit dehydrogenase-like uncharacterized protein
MMKRKHELSLPQGILDELKVKKESSPLSGSVQSKLGLQRNGAKRATRKEIRKQNRTLKKRNKGDWFSANSQSNKEDLAFGKVRENFVAFGVIRK